MTALPVTLELESLQYTYPGFAAQQFPPALSGISIVLKAGSITGLLGTSGSGKTTLIQHLGGLLTPTSGALYLGGEKVLPKSQTLKQLCSTVGVVFQFPEQQFFAETVFDEVAFGPRNQGLPEVEVSETTRWALEVTSMPAERFGARSPFMLSGGEMRRVAIASAIALRPDFLILDEPTAGLDQVTRDGLLALLGSLRDQGAGLLLSSHAVDDMACLCDHLIVLKDGAVFLNGPASEVFADVPKLLEAGLAPPAVFDLLDGLLRSGLIDRGDVAEFIDAVKTNRQIAIDSLAARIARAVV